MFHNSARYYHSVKSISDENQKAFAIVILLASPGVHHFFYRRLLWNSRKKLPVWLSEEQQENANVPERRITIPADVMPRLAGRGLFTPRIQCVQKMTSTLLIPKSY